MGTVKAWLRDDAEHDSWQSRATQYAPVATSTDEDPAPVVETKVNHRLTVRLRSRTGYDDDGVPLFDWTTLLESEAVLYEEREEFDPDAGMTLVLAKAVVLYAGPVQVPETASVTRDDGARYRVQAVRQVPGRLEFDMVRLAQS